MKKQIFTFLTFCIISSTSIFAQETPPQRLTVEERTKAVIEKMAPLQLTDDTKTKVTVVFTEFYNAQQKSMEEMRASGSVDRDAMRTKRDELTKNRNEKLKSILTADQLKKWLEEIEPSMRQQRRPGNK
ncbi:MAG: hypothetical protein WKF35_07505 [Ferruginibacter sp.]